jgi:hypothetical protein
MTYYLTPAPLLALRTVTYCTENEWTPPNKPSGQDMEGALHDESSGEHPGSLSLERRLARDPMHYGGKT